MHRPFGQRFRGTKRGAIANVYEVDHVNPLKAIFIKDKPPPRETNARWRHAAVTGRV